MDSAISGSGSTATATSRLAQRRGWRHHPAVAQFLQNRVAVASLILMIALSIVAYFAPQLAPYNPTKVAVTNKLKPPTSEHWLGTDQFGRDVYSRLLWGARLTVYYAFIGVGIAAGAGVVLGAIAGYARGWVDTVIMRAMDILLAFPGLLLALLVLTILGSGLFNAQVAVGVSLIPVYVRLVRGTMLTAREREHVMAARVTGCRPSRLLIRHVMPSVWSQVAILSTSALGWAIVIAATLNFLGLGVSPPTPEWGADLAAGRQRLSVAWWVSTGPGVAITFVILLINYLGDGLTEALDPSLRRR